MLFNNQESSKNFVCNVGNSRSFVWKKATHYGECKKCKKYSFKNNKKCQIKELNKFELCSEHSKINKLIILIILILLCLFCIFISMLFINWYDTNAHSGHWKGKTREQIEADLNAQVEDGEMNVSIANTIKFFNGSESEGIARIENIGANGVDQKVRITLKDSDEIIYESGAIPPDYSIETIHLNKHLDSGQYKAIALFTGYDCKSHKVKGAVAAEINILIC